MDNQTMRVKFNEYYKMYHEPKLQLIANELGFSKNYLINWKNSKVDISTEKLNLIDRFIKQYKK